MMGRFLVPCPLSWLSEPLSSPREDKFGKLRDDGLAVDGLASVQSNSSSHSRSHLLIFGAYGLTAADDSAFILQLIVGLYSGSYLFVLRVF